MLFDALKLGGNDSRRVNSILTLYGENARTHRICLPQQLDRTTFCHINLPPKTLKELITAAFEPNGWATNKINRSKRDDYVANKYNMEPTPKNSKYIKSLIALYKYNKKYFLNFLIDRISQYGTLSNEYVFAYGGINLDKPYLHLCLPEIDYLGRRRCCNIMPRQIYEITPVTSRACKERKSSGTEIMYGFLKDIIDDDEKRKLCNLFRSSGIGVRLIPQKCKSARRNLIIKEEIQRAKLASYRCEEYSDFAICPKCLKKRENLQKMYEEVCEYDHINDATNKCNTVAKEYLAMAQEFGLVVNPKLRHTFEAMKRLPASDIQNEIAIMRTMLAALLAQIPEGAELRQIPFELADAITVIAQKVTKAALAFEQIQDKLGDRLSPEKMKELAERFISLTEKHFSPSPEQMQAFAEDLLGIDNPASSLNIGIIDKYGVDPENTPVQKEKAKDQASKVFLTPNKAVYSHAEVKTSTVDGCFPITTKEKIGDAYDPFTPPDYTGEKQRISLRKPPGA